MVNMVNLIFRCYDSYVYFVNIFMLAPVWVHLLPFSIQRSTLKTIIWSLYNGADISLSVSELDRDLMIQLSTVYAVFQLLSRDHVLSSLIATHCSLI